MLLWDVKVLYFFRYLAMLARIAFIAGLLLHLQGAHGRVRQKIPLLVYSG